MLPDNSFRPPITSFARPVPGILIDPGETPMVSVSFNAAWLPVVLGALKPLTLQTTFKIEEPNTLELQQKRAMSLIHQFMIASAGDRPFFQDEEEASDETLPDYPWYEQASDWIIELFLAVCATPDAAIAYRVTIPKLRLTIRSGNIGAIFKVLIDDLEYFTGDSYAAIADLIDIEVNVADFAAAHDLGTGPHMLKIVHNGEPGQELAVCRGDIRPEESNMLFRACESGCGLEYSSDGGDTWTCVDLSTCITSIANDAIDAALADGTIGAPGGQPSPSEAPAPGGCKSYHVRLNGNNVWHSPFPVNAGYNIKVTNAKGGWNDGTLAWYCPDGNRYLLGACSSELHSHETGDPSSFLWHMQLVGNIGEVWFDASYTAGYDVPSGTTETDFTFQANDATITDNQGSIEFDVEICAPNTGWCYEWTEFSGWSVISGAQGTRSVQLGKDFGLGSFVITEFRIEYTGSAGVGGTSAYAAWTDVAGSVLITLAYPLAAFPGYVDWTGSQAITGFNFAINGNAGVSGDILITKIRLKGEGTSPFGASNC